MDKNIVTNFNKLLSNYFVVFVKLHNLHWNVVGINFKSIHEYLESLYKDLSVSFDMIAEVLKMHDETPIASLKCYIDLSTIKEIDSIELNGEKVLNIVLHDFKELKCLCDEIRCGADKENLFDIVNIMDKELEWLNKQIWFINAMLK
jgi:starvation-inducible DNA-binding protein